MAPTRPANTTAIEMASCDTTSFAIVLATAVPKMRNATKLKNAAHATARRGDSTLVETTVAMEFAASWKPLTKSKPSATTITATRARLIGRDQACFRTMDSTTLLTSSSVFSDASIASMMSFQRNTSSASYSPENNRASACR
jgi:hypothetical protein